MLSINSRSINVLTIRIYQSGRSICTPFNRCLLVLNSYTKFNSQLRVEGLLKVPTSNCCQLVVDCLDHVTCREGIPTPTPEMAIHGRRRAPGQTFLTIYSRKILNDLFLKNSIYPTKFSTHPFSSITPKLLCR